jgi:hypothetical protein
VDLAAPLALQEFRVGFHDRGRQAKVLSVVGDDEEIERPTKLDRQAGA